MLNKKVFLVLLMLFLILIVVITVGNKFQGKKNIDEQGNIIGVDLYTKPYHDENPVVTIEQKEAIAKEVTGKEKIINNKIKSYLRTFCSSYSDINVFISTNYFSKLKDNVDLVTESNLNFMYIELPQYIYEACLDKTPEYLETLILSLQTDKAYLENLKGKISTNNLKIYIENLSLTEDGLYPKNIKNKEKFNSFFFKEKLQKLEGFYYPYYVKERYNIGTFLAKPIGTLEKNNSNKMIAFRKLVGELEILGFDNIDDFKEKTLIYNGYSSNEEIKKSIINDYKKIISLDKNISIQLSTLGLYSKYLLSGDYKNTLNNLDIKNNLDIFGKKMLLLAITSDGGGINSLSQSWEGKKYFGDSEVGNGIIRLNLIYILTFQKDEKK